MCASEAPLFSTAFASSPLTSRFSPAPANGRFQLDISSKERPLLEQPRGTTSALATGINIINTYVGMVLLSQHFCFALSGWLNTVTLATLTAFGAFTGQLIILSYQKIQAEGTPVPSYSQIGERCLGRFGKVLVTISSIFEIFVAILCMNIIVWSNAKLLLPWVELHWIIAGCVALSMPTNLLKDFSMLAFLSSFGIGCILLIATVVMYDVLAIPAEGLVTPPTDGALLEGVPMSASIMLAGLTGHVALPPMFAEMKQPSAFVPTLWASFAVMFAIYAGVGACGYLLYGEDSHVLITTDMSEGAQDKVSKMMTALILVGMTFKLFCSNPMCIAVLVDISKNLYRERTGSPLSVGASDRVRWGIWTATTFSALFVYSWLQYVTALIGINSMLISILLPLVFYTMLHADQMGLLSRVGFAIIIVATIAFTITITWIDWLEFLKTIDEMAAASGGKRK